MIFANPPLVELVAELRWVPGATTATEQATGGLTLQFPLVAPYLEETFSRFSTQAASRGFVISERLVPAGFLNVPFSVVYRFRKLPTQDQNFLYQIGPGVFSANALPPYRDWDSFRPIVQDGVEALLASRHASENREFAAVMLRYIDLFTEEFTMGLKSFRFLNEILGINLQLPNTLREQAAETDMIQSGLQLQLPLKNGLAMALTLQDGGIVAGKTGILMTTQVVSTQPTRPDLRVIMETLENAHRSIRVTFLGLTERLTAQMQPLQ